MEPGNLDVLICLGNAFSGLGQGDDAIETYNRVLAMAPGNAEAITRRGEEFQRKGGLDRALLDYEHAGEMFPSSPFPILRQGEILALTGRPDEALTRFSRAIQLDPGLEDGYVLHKELPETTTVRPCYRGFYPCSRVKPRFGEMLSDESRGVCDCRELC